MCERWVGDWPNCNILTPSSFGSASFSFCWAAQSGALRAHNPLLGAGSLYGILSPTTESKLTELVCGPGLYNCLRPPASCGRHIYTQFNPSTVKVIPWHLWLDGLVIYTGAFLIWQLGPGSTCYISNYDLNILTIAHHNEIFIWTIHSKYSNKKTKKTNKSLKSAYMFLFVHIYARGHTQGTHTNIYKEHLRICIQRTFT